MTTESKAQRAGLPHAVFLQRVTDEPAMSAQVRLGQGAFLTLRFVDLLAPDREPPTPDVFRYQWAATERYCAELAGEGTEASHLSCIVRSASEAHHTSDVNLVAPALFAYALYLEQESHLAEAEDVLQTMIEVGADRLQTSDMVSAWMRIGRVCRLKADFDRADVAYREAGRIAEAIGDAHGVLLSRIGECNVIHFRGNLAQAEIAWRTVLADASEVHDREVQAQSEHGLGNVLSRRGRMNEGAPHLWRAFELYEDESSQGRAMADLGIVLVALGEVQAAEQALQHVLRVQGPAELVVNAKIELMHCASFRRDRVTFERWRESAISDFTELPPNIRADYHLKAGIGFARFGSLRRAENELRNALEIAAAHDLHEMVFRVEQLMAGLKECGAPEFNESAASAPVIQSDSLHELSACLAALAT